MTGGTRLKVLRATGAGEAVHSMPQCHCLRRPRSGTLLHMCTRCRALYAAQAKATVARGTLEGALLEVLTAQGLQCDGATQLVGAATAFE